MAVSHWAEFSARKDNFFCLLTLTVPLVGLKQKKIQPPHGKFHLMKNGHKTGPP